MTKLDKIRFKLFSNYEDELNLFTGDKTKHKDKKAYFRSISQNQTNTRQFFASRLITYEDTYWIDIWHSSKIIGFFIIGLKPNCHPCADYYIQETYIKPEYRRQKIASNYIGNFMKTYKGTYCLYIINNNYAAKQFWKNLFERAGYEPVGLKDTEDKKPYTLYGFEPKGE